MTENRGRGGLGVCAGNGALIANGFSDLVVSGYLWGGVWGGVWGDTKAVLKVVGVAGMGLKSCLFDDLGTGRGYGGTAMRIGETK